MVVVCNLAKEPHSICLACLSLFPVGLVLLMNLWKCSPEAKIGLYSHGYYDGLLIWKKAAGSEKFLNRIYEMPIVGKDPERLTDRMLA
jgi:hypothetical protein